MTRALTLDDIVDNRSYEREREQFRADIIQLKKRRRVGVGPFVTLVFENRETIRFQIQEMARVEKLGTDKAIEGELAAYNPLIPEPGTLSATMFIELTSEEGLRDWLPKLLGIETAVVLSAGSLSVRCTPEAGHAAQLTRSDITSAVHYVQFAVSPELEAAMKEAGPAGGVSLSLDHPEYRYSAVLLPETVDELLRDVAGM